MRLIPTILALARIGSISFVLLRVWAVMTAHLHSGRGLHYWPRGPGVQDRCCFSAETCSPDRRCASPRRAGRSCRRMRRALSLFALVPEKVDVDAAGIFGPIRHAGNASTTL